MKVGAWAISFPMLASCLPKRSRTHIWGAERNDEMHHKQSIWLPTLAVSSVLCCCSTSWFPFGDCNYGYSTLSFNIRHWSLGGTSTTRALPPPAFFVSFCSFFVFDVTKYSPLLPTYSTNQNVLLAPWLFVAIELVFQTIAKTRPQLCKELERRPPPLSFLGSCTSMYRVFGFVPRHDPST